MALLKNYLATPLLLFLTATSVLTANTVTLEEKLNHQFEMYERLRNETITCLTPEMKEIPFTRAEWEVFLMPSKEMQFQSKDLNDLKAFHTEIAERARLQYAGNSVIDLTLLRNNHRLLKQFTNELPKGGMLHVHPYGTLDRQMAKTILLKHDPILDGQKLLNNIRSDEQILLYNNEFRFLQTLIPGKRFSELSSADKETFLNLLFMPSNPKFDHPFERFSASFIFIAAVAKSVPGGKKIVIQDFLMKAYAEGIRYVEFTDNVKATPEDIAEKNKWSEELYKATGVIVRWNASFKRVDDPRENAERINDLIQLTSTGMPGSIVGIDLLGNERNTPALETGYLIYAPLNASIKGKHPQKNTSYLKRTIHAGEIGHVHNVRDALILGTDRIGHGVLLVNDPVTLEYARRKQLPIEINLHSNLKLQSIRDYSEHPFLLYLRLGLPVSLSTDDEGILETNISTEFAIAIENTDISYAELKQLAYNSITTSFASEDVKKQLIADLDTRFKVFEEKWLPVLGGQISVLQGS